MAIPHKPEPAILFVAMLATDHAALALAADAVERILGHAFIGMRTVPFARTSYYRDELGGDPVRAFLAFPGIFPQKKIAGIKLATNQLEMDLAKEVNAGLPRPVNLDPGFITLSKVVLASAKDFSHRIYLDDGIFAEVTLQYRGGRFVTLPWTFPDYAAPDYHPFLLDVRGCIRLFAD